jgi:hypothetical protein
MRRSLITTLVAAAALTTAACETTGYDGGRYGGGPTRYAGPSGSGCYAGERRADCRERLRYEQQTQQRYVWRGDHYERQGQDQNAAGAAVAAGVIGFILGAAIAGSNRDRDTYDAHKNDRDWHNRCAGAHPGYDPRTGTYAGPDGMRRYCTG